MRNLFKFVVANSENLDYYSKRHRETPGHYPLHHHMKLLEILITPPDWLAVILVVIGASLYLGALILLKNLLH